MATYVPSATEVTQPTGDKKVASAPPEFRALKVFVNAIYAQLAASLIDISGFQAQLDALEAAIGAGDNSVALATNLANLTNPVLGDYLVGHTDPLASVGILVAEYLRLEGVHVEQFGAVNDENTDSSTAIQAALNSGATIVKATKSYGLLVGLIIPAGVQFISGTGQANAVLKNLADITTLTIQNVNDACVDGFLIKNFATQTASVVKFVATTVTITRNKLRNIQFSSSAPLSFVAIDFSAVNAWGSWGNLCENITMSGVGTMLLMGTGTVNSWVRSNTFRNIQGNDVLYGLNIINSAGDGSSENLFQDWKIQTSARTLFCAHIPNSFPGENQQNKFDNYTSYDLQGSAIQLYIGTGVRDTLIEGSTGDYFVPGRFTDNGVRTRIIGEKDYLTKLLSSGRLLHIPTNGSLAPTVTGTGTTEQTVSHYRLATGATNPSTATLGSSAALGGLNVSAFSIDFGKKVIFGFNLTRINSVVGSVGRVQLKTTVGAGGLAVAGIGIQINDLALSGESYGSAVATVSLGSIVNNQSVDVMIIHYPQSRVEFWLDGVYVAQQINAANIPLGTIASFLSSIIANNAASDVQMLVARPWVWTEF